MNTHRHGFEKFSFILKRERLDRIGSRFRNRKFFSLVEHGGKSRIVSRFLAPKLSAFGILAFRVWGKKKKREAGRLVWGNWGLCSVLAWWIRMRLVRIRVDRLELGVLMGVWFEAFCWGNVFCVWLDWGLLGVDGEEIMEGDYNWVGGYGIVCWDPMILR